MSGLRNFGHGAAMDIAEFKSESVPTSGGPAGLKPATQQVGNLRYWRLVMRKESRNIRGRCQRVSKNETTG